MMKKIAVRLYHGFTITMFVNIIVHFIVAQITGSVVTTGFAARFSNEASAVLVQIMLVGVIGMAFAGSAAIFEIERWGFLLQGIVHFLFTAAVWMPIVWICWSPMSGKGMILTIIGWTLTYAVNWAVQYFIWKKRILQLNARISASRESE